MEHGAQKSKVINLDSSPVFKRVVHYREARGYSIPEEIPVMPQTRRWAVEVRRRIIALRRAGKLDEIDMSIIAMRQLSPMPTWREIGQATGVSKQAAAKRLKKIKNAINKG